MTDQYILTIDQGTSSTKALILNKAGRVVAQGSEPLYTDYHDNGWVEQNPEDIFTNVLSAVRNCLNQYQLLGLDLKKISCLGISNQRETFVLWDETGKPWYPAIVWQCKRSIAICERLKKDGLQESITSKTGLIIDPYFSATKLIWLIENNNEIAAAVNKGKAYFGTIDTWLMYKFTHGQVYATDHTNASRTLMFNLHSLSWDHELLKIFGISGIKLPEVKSSSAAFGATNLSGLLPISIPITAAMGDSHAAAFGHGCIEQGNAKATLGTGCSVLMNIGNKPLPSAHGMMTTICWSIDQRVDFAYEGVIVSCGSTLEWLRKELNLYSDIKETASMANAVSNNGGVYLIPAFSGLGSPHWQMNRKASISGITFGTTKNHIVRAALESIPYQIADVLSAMEKDSGIKLSKLMTDGGITANAFIMQYLSSLLGIDLQVINEMSVSAFGVGYMAGIHTNIFHLKSLETLEIEKKTFSPIPEKNILNSYDQWKKIIEFI